MEIQRLGSIAPLAVPHRALKDIDVNGKFMIHILYILSSYIMTLFFGTRIENFQERLDNFRETSRKFSRVARATDP